MMIGSTHTANTVLGVLTMASLLLSAKGDCQTCLASDSFIAFQQAPDNSTSLAEKAELCKTNISVYFDLDMFKVKASSCARIMHCSTRTSIRSVCQLLVPPTKTFWTITSST